MELVKTWPTLYSYDKHGKIREWNVNVSTCNEYSHIHILYGLREGKKIDSYTKIKNGKNIGKKNETNHVQQALLEAQSEWNKKINREGYVEKLSKKSEKNYSPMLAHEYQKCKKHVVFPCFMQPKLDGYRMIYSDEKCISRQGLSFDILHNTHLYQELIQLPKDVVFDGELYVHNGIFEHLGILRKKKISDEDIKKLEGIEYHIYDVMNTDLDFSARWTSLCRILDGSKFSKIRKVETVLLQDEDAILKNHEKFVNKGYEGSMVRNCQGKYECKYRSRDLLKYKDFKDEEFEIIDFSSEKDPDSDDLLIVWVCQTKDGTSFHVRPQGTKEERKNIYQQCHQDGFSDYRGKQLWVKFFDWTDKHVPRFPTTKTKSVLTYIRENL